MSAINIVTAKCLANRLFLCHIRMKHSRKCHSNIFCLNPRCSHRNRSFVSERAFAQHVARVPSCAAFLYRSVQESERPSLRQKIDHEAELDIAVKYHSNISQSVLRRDFVNAVIDAKNLHISKQSAGMDDNFSVNDLQDNSSFDDNGNPDFEDTASPSSIPVDEPFVFTRDQKWTLLLLKLLDEINAPDHAFSSIIRWAQNALAAGFRFTPPGGFSRNRNIDLFRKSMLNADLLLPRLQKVVVPHGMPIDVVTFDFVPQLLRLLQNGSLMTPENLVLDFYQPLQKYHAPENILGEALSGTVYSEAFDHLVQDPEKDLLVPIIQWIDRTHITESNRYSLKPYMFTPAIFRESCRRNIEFWGYHGFLPRSDDSKAQNAMKQQGDNNRNYHAQLAVVLETFQTARPRLRDVWLPIGPQRSMQVNIIPCLLFIIQDMQEGDQLCSRYATHMKEVQRHCRACDIGYADLGKHNAKCKWILAKPMQEIASGNTKDHKALQKRWSQHRVQNTYYNMPLADPRRGVFGCTPVETMHAVRLGLIAKVTSWILETLTDSQSALLDNVAIDFHKRHFQTYRKSYPGTDFSHGVTNLTRLTASERVGLLFLFVILANLDVGSAIFEMAGASQDGKKSCLKDTIQLFEALLAFDAWLNQDTYWSIAGSGNAMHSAQSSIESLLNMCRKRLPQHSFQFPKFHEMLHIVSDMERFGAPKNFCAQRPESLLVFAAKRPGRRAQKRSNGSQYELNAAQRLEQSFVLDLYHQKIFPTKTSSNHINESSVDVSDVSIRNDTGHATFARVLFDSTSGNYEIQWATKTNTEHMRLQPELLQFLVSEFGPSITICTEYRRENFIFRCHPYFQSHAPRYDWLRIQFEDDIYPSRLAAVVEVLEEGNNKNHYLIVQCATSKTTHRHRHGSVLFTEWNWSPSYYCVTPDNIHSPCFVIASRDDADRILETLPYEDWAGQFTDTNYNNY